MNDMYVRAWVGVRFVAALCAGLVCVDGRAQSGADDEAILALPMPDGGSMLFRPVYLGVGDGPFAAREIKVGDRSAGGYKEYPTVMILGGSFLGDRGGQRDWFYYLGIHEVTERQYDAILHPERGTQGLDPKTNVSWFEVQAFIHGYNQWLAVHARDALPRLDEFPGFLRLPTEEEWEFAARGGVAVTADVFDRRHPYSGSINRHEWFSGPQSSHDRVKRVGMLRPNPLGLYDMLGNVSEMTASDYRVEYLQGRRGGFVSRGGNFRTPERSLRASLRVEQPYYRGDGTPSAQREMGFRLAIGAPVFAGRETSQRLESGWEEYRRERPAPGPAAHAAGPTAARTVYSLDDARGSLDRLERNLTQASASEEVVNTLGLLRASFEDVEALIRKAERDSAAAWARMASSTAWFLRREEAKVPASERVLEISRQTGVTAQLALFEERHANLLANIRDAVARYAWIMVELGKLSPPVVRDGFDAYARSLVDLGQAEQIMINNRVLEQFEEYARTQRLNMEVWRQQLGSGIDPVGGGAP